MRKTSLFLAIGFFGVSVVLVPTNGQSLEQNPGQLTTKDTQVQGGNNGQGSSPLTPATPLPRVPGGKTPDPFFDPSYPERTRADGWPIYSDRLERWRKLRGQRLRQGQKTDLNWRYLSSELKLRTVITLGKNRMKVILIADPDKESLTLNVGDMLFDGVIKEIGFERQDRNGLMVNIPFMACEVREPKGTKKFRIVIYGE